MNICVVTATVFPVEPSCLTSEKLASTFGALRPVKAMVPCGAGGAAAAPALARPAAEFTAAACGEGFDLGVVVAARGGGVATAFASETATRAEAAARGAPQNPQNLLPAGSAFRHFGHVTICDACAGA